MRNSHNNQYGSHKIRYSNSIEFGIWEWESAKWSQKAICHNIQGSQYQISSVQVFSGPVHSLTVPEIKTLNSDTSTEVLVNLLEPGHWLFASKLVTGLVTYRGALGDCHSVRLWAMVRLRFGGSFIWICNLLLAGSPVLSDRASLLS